MEPSQRWSLAKKVGRLDGMRVWMVGPPGVGKSWLARGSGRETISLTLTEGTSMSELRGHYLLKGQDTLWHGGLVPRAWSLSHQRPTTLVLDELDHAAPESWSFLLQALEDSPKVLLPTGELISPHPSLSVIATSNSVEGVPPALLDRFPIRFHLPEPNPAIKASLPPKVAMLPLNVRQQVAFAKLLPLLPLEEVLACFFDPLTAQEVLHAWNVSLLK